MQDFMGRKVPKNGAVRDFMLIKMTDTNGVSVILRFKPWGAGR